MIQRINVLHVIGNLDRSGGAEKLAYIYAKYHAQKKVSLIYLCLKEKGYLGEKIEKLGIPVYTFRLKRGLEYWKLPFKLLKLLKKHPTHIVHTHLLEADFFVRLLMVFFHKIKVVRTIHATNTIWQKGLVEHAFHQTIFYKFNLFLDRFNTSTLFISNAVKDSFVRYRDKTDSKYQIIYNCFDNGDMIASKFGSEIKKELNLTQKHFPIICIIGRLDRQKGHSILISALAMLKLRFPNFCLLVIGDGPLSFELRNIVKKLNLSINIIFLGRKTNIADYLQITDIYVQPSLWEGFGMTVVEAMAMGLPVIASQSGGFLELIEDGYNGKYFEPNNPKDLYNKIISLSESKELRYSIGRNAFKYAEERFPGNVYADKLTAVYKKII